MRTKKRTCPECHQTKPEADFVIRKRGVVCNSCRREHNAKISSAKNLTDAYIISLILQGRPWRRISPEEIAQHRQKLLNKRMIRAARKASNAFQLLNTVNALCETTSKTTSATS